MKKQVWAAIVGVLMVAMVMVGVSINGCGTSGSGNPTVQTYSVINGTVKDNSGTVISGVTVTTSASSAATNSQGYFSISNISTTREVVVFSKTGNLSTQKVVSLTAGAAVFVDVVMVASNSSHSLAVTGGGTVSDTGGGLTGSVIIPAGALNATGNVNITVTPFNPTTTSPEAFPSGFTGIMTTGEVVPFKSFGFMNVTITDSSGSNVSLASGKTATIEIGVPTTLTAEAATIGTIPLWYINSSGNWVEDGVATYDATAKLFRGIVTHFSTWNCDMPYTTAYITGKVVDSNGNPVPNAEVRVKSTNNNWSNSAFTGSDGKFGPVAVEAGVACVAYATKGGLRSSNKSVSAVTAGQTSDIGNIVLDAPLVQITLTWGANPRDLDSHLTVPASVDAGSRYDLYYGNRSSTSTTRWPYVNLDTDNTQSYGPEITSIYKLIKGTYRFNVHDFAGSSSITSSEANINLIITGGGTQAIYNFTPPSGLTTGVDDVWQVCDINVDSNGNVSGVSTLNGVLHGISASTHSAFSPGSSETVSVSSTGAMELIKK